MINAALYSCAKHLQIGDLRRIALIEGMKSQLAAPLRDADPHKQLILKMSIELPCRQV
jgi:hypothetical protein